MNPSMRPMRRASGSQRGVALVLAMIVLLVLVLGALAVTRSMGTALTGSGNLAFRRDLVNQAEQAVARAVASSFPKGSNATGNALTSLNYSPVTLDANVHGIPHALLDDDVFGAIGVSANDVVGSSSDIRIRYVVERLCNRALDRVSADHCIIYEQPPVGGSSHLSGNATVEVQPIYRVTVRALGPRNTKVFIQSTFTKPEA